MEFLIIYPKPYSIYLIWTTGSGLGVGVEGFWWHAETVKDVWLLGRIWKDMCRTELLE